MAKRSALIYALTFLAWLLVASPSQAQEVITLVVEDNQNVRDIAAQYLGDADLWTEVLRESNLSTIADVRPGVTLRIPQGKIRRTNTALENALEAIQQATEQGAKVFAELKVGEAIALRDQALEQRNNGLWEESYQLAQQATQLAQQARNDTDRARNQSAQAVLYDRNGRVEGRTPSDLVWNDVPLQALLTEEQKVRTLSASLAEIRFRDESRLRLAENSQAVIQRMRVDLLNNRQEANVSLVEGDVYALLGGGKSPRKEFNVDVPGVEVETNSQNFWASKSGRTSSFANYDDEDMQITAGGETVTLQKNQGTRIDGRPLGIRDLLPPPLSTAPVDDHVLRQTRVVVTWQAVTSAASYVLEVARDPGFANIIRQHKSIQGTQFTLTNLDDGHYYWRLAAVDDFNLPGPRGIHRRFHVRLNNLNPYLVVNGAIQEIIVREPVLTLTGETERDVDLTVNGDTLAVNSAGVFRTSIRLENGLNILTIRAVNEDGHTSVRTRRVIYMPDQKATIRYDDALNQPMPGRFITYGTAFTLRGQTQTGAVIDARATHNDTHVRTYATGDEGDFRMILPLSADSTTFALHITAPSGFVTEEQIVVLQDQQPPEILVETLPPATTINNRLSLRGEVVRGKRLLLNDAVVPLADSRFDEVVNLRPGLNTMELIAEDEAGNRTRTAWEVILDQDPPQYLRHAVSQRQVSGGESLTIEVYARDASSLKQAAAFELTVNTQLFTGYLQLDASGQRYTGTLTLPPATRGQVRLRSVELEDYFNNKRLYEIQ